MGRLTSQSEGSRHVSTLLAKQPEIVPTSIPKRANTVSLLASFALRSPTSPFPFTGLAKCIVIAAFEPPAEIPHRDLKTALRQRAPTRKLGRENEMNKGDIVSRMTAVSFKTSASSR